MIELNLTRRALVGRITAGTILSTVAGKAFAAPSPAGKADPRLAETAALVRTAYPHPALDNAFYSGVAQTYLSELAANPAGLKELDRGLALLNGSYIAPFADLPAVIQKGMVDKYDQEPFFKAMLFRTAELIYRDHRVWKLVGFEGSSVEYGGYIDRGFNDIDWLPKDGSAQ